MNAVEERAVASTFDVEVVKQIVLETSNQTTQLMVLVLMQGHGKLNFKQLAEKHINKKLKTELDRSDEKVRMVYAKLFEATHQYIRIESQVLVSTLNMIKQQTSNDLAGELFLGSFVLPATQNMIERLNNEQPEALEHTEIWGVTTEFGPLSS